MSQYSHTKDLIRYRAYGFKHPNYAWKMPHKGWFVEGELVLVEDWMFVDGDDIYRLDNEPNYLPDDIWDIYLEIYRRHLKTVLNVTNGKRDPFDEDLLMDDLLKFANQYGFSGFLYGKGIKSWGKEGWENTCPPTLPNICQDMALLDLASKRFKEDGFIIPNAIEICEMTTTKPKFTRHNQMFFETLGTQGAIWTSWYQDCMSANIRQCDACNRYFRAIRPAFTCSSKCRQSKRRKGEGNT